MAKKVKASTADKGNWVVRMKCVVIKDVVCRDCTEEEARVNPWDHAGQHVGDDTEAEQIDWTVQSVERDE